MEVARSGAQECPDHVGNLRRSPENLTSPDSCKAAARMPQETVAVAETPLAHHCLVYLLALAICMPNVSVWHIGIVWHVFWH
jgi:hypothetical protein